jgi:hypothetical protein
MESKATDGMNSRFTKDDGTGGADSPGPRLGVNSKEALVFLRAGSQAVPGTRGGAAQFSPHGQVFLSKEQENDIAAGVAIHDA